MQKTPSVHHLKFKLAVTIYLPGPNVPIHIFGVEFFVINSDMEEVFPFLKVIRLDFKENLIRVHILIHIRHIDSINKDNLKITESKYKEISYMPAEDDPIELPGCLAAGIGIDSDASFDEGFEKINATAEKIGISPHGSSLIK